jgi:hypothetical protein
MSDDEMRAALAMLNIDLGDFGPEAGQENQVMIERMVARELRSVLRPMVNEVRQWQRDDATAAATATVDAAIAAGRLAPTQREWAIDYAAGNPNGFQTFIGVQTTAEDQGRETTICAALGITTEQLNAAKAKRAGR